LQQGEREPAQAVRALREERATIDAECVSRGIKRGEVHARVVMHTFVIVLAGKFEQETLKPGKALTIDSEAQKP
jgi:hypothetical protein